MRVFGQVFAIGTAAAVLSMPVSLLRAQAPAKDAATILAQAREALGGEKKLSAIKNFVATGRTQQVRGDNLVPIEFEIAVEFPDKYVRKDEIPAQESGPTSTGFNGEELIQLPVPSVPMPPPGMGRAGAPAGPPPQAQLDAMRRQRVAAVKQDFARLTLGMFAGSFSGYPLTFTYVGEAEAPQGRADVLEAKAPNFTLRFFVNSQTHLPIMVSWQAPSRPAGPPGGPGRGGAPGLPVPPGAPDRGGPPAGAAPAGAAPPGAAPAGAAPPPPGAATRGGPPSAPPPGQAPPPNAPPAPAGQAPAPPSSGPVPSAPGAGPGMPPGAAAPGAAGPGRGGPPAAPVEFRIYYGDYREVDGVQWPFRLRRASGPDTTEETTFDRFRINTKIDPKKFEVRK
jgi:hypothetical protein